MSKHRCDSCVTQECDAELPISLSSLTQNGLNVLHVIDSLGLGGAQVLVRSVLSFSKDNRIGLFVLRSTSPTVPIQNARHYTYASKSKYSIGSLFALLRLIRNDDISIIHVHLWRSLVYVIAAAIISRKKVPIVYHEHGQICGNDVLGIIGRSAYRLTIHVACMYGVRFIAVSNFVRRSLIQLRSALSEQTVVIRNCSPELTDVQEKCLEASRRQRDHAAFTFGFAGRIEKYKGWREFITAARYLKGNPNVRFIIAGIGSEQRELESMIATDDLNNVRFVGYASDMTVDFYAQIDCLVVPSHIEALGLMPLEGFRHSVPVIASNIPGLNEVVSHEETGLLFQAKSVEGLLEAMNFMCRDFAARERFKTNGALFVENLGIDQYLRQLQAVYDGLDR